MSNAELKRRLRWSCFAILLVGLCSALLINLFVEDTPDDTLGYVIVNGVSYPLSTQDSKTYRREVQRFGGKAALALDDFRRWFEGFWRGRALARTLAWISVLLSLAVYLFSSILGPDTHPEARDRSERDESD